MAARVGGFMSNAYEGMLHLIKRKRSTCEWKSERDMALELVNAIAAQNYKKVISIVECDLRMRT